MRNYFTLDGVDSRDFGVYISGQGTFSAPGRDYNIIPVPGRNGDLVGPEQRFTNGSLTYSAFIYANFKQNISDFRNFLLSLFGYHDLIDSYHPDEIRKVFFEGAFEPEVTTKNDAGSFDITFNCKPQRYLASGQEVITLEAGAGETETYSGEVATFDNLGDDEITALSVAVEPVQDLHGYDSPWPGGGGKNLANPQNSTNPNRSDYSYSTENDYLVEGTKTGSGGTFFAKFSAPVVNGENYIFSFESWEIDGVSSACQVYLYEDELWGTNITSFTIGSAASRRTWTATITGTIVVGIYTASSATDKTLSLSGFMIRHGSVTDATFAPYSNICPISGWDAVSIWNKPTHDTTTSPTVTIQLGQTVYGGTLDVTGGKMVVDRAINVIDGTQSIGYNGIQAYGGVQVRYTPTPAKALAESTATQNSGLVSDKFSTSNAYITAPFELTGRATNANFYFNLPETVTTRAQAITWFTNNPTQVVYELATPFEISLTPTQIAAIAGQTNNVWSDAGDVTVEVFTPEKPVITNPTRFNSRPLLRVYGTGILGIGSQSVTITQADEYTDIDSEMMDAYKGTANKNAFVQLTDYNFPVFTPGENNISLGEGITKVEITPRWWKL